MGVQDDNPQNNSITVELVDTGAGNFAFTRIYIFNEHGDLDSLTDFDIDGNPYVAVGPVQRSASGTTILDVTGIETTTTLVDNLDGTATYTNEDGTQVTISLGDTVDLTSIETDITNLQNEQINQNTAINTTLTNITNLTTDIEDLDQAITQEVIDRTSADTALQTLLEQLTYHEFQREDTPLANQTTTQQPHQVFSFTVPTDGNYKFNSFFLWSTNSIGTDINIVMTLDGPGFADVDLRTSRMEPGDTAGAGIIVGTTAGGTINSGTDQRYNGTLQDIQFLAAGTYDLILQFDASTTNDIPTIYESLLEVMRVN